MEDHRRILLYGDTLILGSLGAVLRNWSEFEVIPLSPPLPGRTEVEALEPDVVLFDIETTRPETVFSLLETRPGLLLLGISPEGNLIRLWSGRELREVSGKQLKELIEEHLADVRPSQSTVRQV